MKVTMQDVAKEAGVDKATVSRVLKGDHRISEKTRMKVIEAVRRLNYRLDQNARNLSTNRSGLVGAVMSEFNTIWFAPFVAGLDRAIANSEYELVLKCTDGNPKRAVRELGKLLDRSVEGIIWADSKNGPECVSVPLVTLGFKMGDYFSVLFESGQTVPTFETGVLAGRFLLNIISGKPVPSRDIIISTAGAAEVC
ncbi:MAG: LacI family DNA-binding transcriptional regulator [Synergistaceae bacterium]|nr:LacI family DNA-binding transcriptional regulator [Synergistaceae bacterium]